MLEKWKVEQIYIIGCEIVDNRRLYYVDWLRALTILSLIPFHAALTYLDYGSVYIKSPIIGAGAIPFVVITAILSDFFMTLLFFLSGISSFYSLKLRNSGRYIQERIKKLLLPFVLGTLLLCPVQAYMKALSEGFHGSLLQFVPLFFSAKIVYYLGYAHLWFLLYLFVFSIICAPLFIKWRNTNKIEKIGKFVTKGNRILLPVAFIILTEFVLRPFFHGSQTFIGDWANDIVYLSMFLFGYFYAADDRIQNKVKEYFNASKIIGLFSFAIILFLNCEWAVNASNAVYLMVVWGIAKGFYECSAIIFLLCIAKKYLNKDSRQLRFLSKASFPIYIFHFLPLTFFTLLFMSTKLTVYLKYIIVVALSFVAVLAIYEALSGLMPLKRKLFNKGNS
jgi:Predicted acyltransferases